MTHDPQPAPRGLRRALPRTRAGWIAVALTATFATCYGGAITLIAARGVNDANPWLTIFAFTGLGSAVGAGISAIVAIVRQGERGLLIVLPALLGVIALVFLLGEFLVPH